MKILIALFFVFLGTLGFAFQSMAEGSVNCLDKDAVNRIRSQLNIKIEKNENLCDPESSTYRVLESLIFAEGLRLEGPAVASPWNQNIVPARWIDYIKKLSPSILSATKSRHGQKVCAAGAAAFVDFEVKKEMFICDRLKLEPPIVVISAMIHESRHHEGFPHVGCSRKAGAEGVLGCDEYIQKKGAYAASVEVWTKIGKSSVNVHPAMMDLSLAMALAYDDYFNWPAFSFKRVVYLQKKNGDYFVYDGKRLQPVPGLASKNGILAPREKSDLIFYPRDSRETSLRLTTFDSVTFSLQEPFGSYQKEYLSASPSRREQLQDLIYGPEFNGRIWGNEIDISAGDEEFKVKFSHGAPVRLFSSSELYGKYHFGDVYVLSNEMKMYKIYLMGTGRIHIVEIDNVINNYQSIAELDEKTLLLNLKGEVVVREDLKPDSQLKGQKFIYMSRPLRVPTDSI